ncbi:MAG: adenylate/guanylate cyclase domain-containing protein [Gaiellaceae bacterium]
MPDLPSGTVTFLFTDIEGSTRLLKQLRDEYAAVLAEHQHLLRTAFEQAGGHEIDTQGDAFFVAFRRAKDAVLAALAAQRALEEHAWPDGVRLRVRMGIHTAEPAVGADRYVGLGVHRGARICSAGHGGQVLLSNATRELVEDDLPSGIALRDLGECRLKDIDRPEHVFQLVGDGLAGHFPPLKTLDAQPEEATPFSGREGELAAAAHSAVRPRRLGRRKLLAGAGVLLAGAAATVAVLLADPFDSGQALTTVPPNSVGVIDPGSNDIVAAIQVGESPGPIAASAGRISVANRNSATVSQIDIRRRDVINTFGIGGIGGFERLADLVVERGLVWVSDVHAGTVTAYGRNQVAFDDRIKVFEGDFAVSAGTALATVGGDQLWVLNSRPASLGRIDLDEWIDVGTGRVDERVPLDGTPTVLAADQEFVWVGNAEGTLFRLDPVLGQRRTVDIGKRVNAIALGTDAVWVVTGGAAVARVERDLTSITRIRVGRLPTAVAVGADAVWVANSLDGTVSRIDPRTRTVEATIEVGNRPQDLTVAGGLVWVTVRER